MKILTDNKGIALILVLLIISIIVAVTLQFNIASRSAVYGAADLADTFKLMYIAKSGFFGAEALLIEDDNEFDSLNEDWAQSALISNISSAFFQSGAFDLRIEDEAGKLPLNKLVEGIEFNVRTQDMLVRFLGLSDFDLDEQQVRDIVDAIKDWIDEDDEITGFGAENAYYQGLDTPYECKNGPLDSVDELLRIKGITDTLYYGTEDSPGLASFITLHGDGRININTAPALVLRSLDDEITDDMVAEMEEFRKDENNDLSDPLWYKNVTGMAAISIDEELVTTASSIFKITSTGYLDTMNLTACGVVERQRQQKKTKILSWKVD